MNRRTAIKAMLGGLCVGGCKERSERIERRLSFADKMNLMEFMKIVETGSNFMNIVVGARGELGPLQITKQYVDDCNRIVRENKFSYDMRRYMQPSRTMVLLYWDHYATSERLGHEPTREDLARIHNGGPEGWRKASTKAYWRKVRKEIENGSRKSNSQAS